MATLWIAEIFDGIVKSLAFLQQIWLSTSSVRNIEISTMKNIGERVYLKKSYAPFVLGTV